MRIIDAISKRLDEIFNGEYAIYLENVEQGLKVPCFFIHPVYSSDKNRLIGRKNRLHEFDVVFLPEDEGYISAFATVTDKLFTSFDSVTLEDGTILYTFDRRINVSDDVLHFMVTFQFDYLEELPNEDLQMSLELNGGDVNGN